MKKHTDAMAPSDGIGVLAKRKHSQLTVVSVTKPMRFGKLSESGFAGLKDKKRIALRQSSVREVKPTRF